MIRLLPACILLSAIALSCKKTDNNKISPTAQQSINEVFSQLSLQPKTLTVDASTGGSFFGNSGTRYVFFANSFQLADGTAVTGNVQIQVCEYLLKGDMLFSKMLPISNGEPLLSGGEIFVSATQGKVPVYLKAGSSFRAYIPTGGAQLAGMQLFTGHPNQDTIYSKVNWVMKPNGKQVGVFLVSGGDTLYILSDSLKTCNADKFMPSPNYQSFKVTIAVSGATLTATSQIFAYALYDNYKAEYALGFGGGTYNNGVFEEHHVPDIPVHFVAFTMINGKFYGGVLGVTPTTGSNYTVTLAERDLQDFRKQLNAL